MRSRLCNKCGEFGNVNDWDYGCPNCGYSHYLGDYVQISEYPGVLVMPDIKPYQNMIDGKEIGSRSTHRAFLRRHNATEIGNETKYLGYNPNWNVDPRGRKELLAAQVQALGGHKQFKEAVKREIEYNRWNSRKD